MKKIKAGLVIIFFIIAYGIVGRLEYEQEKHDAEEHKKVVCDDAWSECGRRGNNRRYFDRD